LIGVAIKVTGVPEQIVVVETAIETAGVTDGVIVTAGAVEVTVDGEAQVSLEVIVTLTISPLTKELEVYELEFVPTILPLSCH